MSPVAPYGTWISPLGAARVARSSLRIDTPLVVDADDVYWVESRPDEAGRGALMRWSLAHGIEDVTPAGVSVRSRVHEYGGGAFAVRNGEVVFSNDADQALVRRRRSGTCEALTVAPGARYADLVFDPARERLLAVREDHRDRPQAPVTTIVAIPLDARGAGSTLVAGHDFYASPQVSPDGLRLVWLAWSQFRMPWDATELWLGEFDDEGGVVGARRIAGGDGESIGHPRWSPDGVLHFVSDRSGWWNLYRWDGVTAQPLRTDAAEYGLPHWVFGQTTYAFGPGGIVLASRVEKGVSRLVIVEETDGRARPLASEIEPSGAVQMAGGHAVVLGGSPMRPRGVYRIDLTTGSAEPLRTEAAVDLPAAFVSRPEPFDFESANGRTTHAWYYPPTHPGFSAPDGARPPLIVVGHGGPTSCADRHLNLRVQFWTTRGFALLDVNYGGSTGHGRAYRERLDGAWGIVDVEDCVEAARAATARGLADPRRLIIRGSSAGGFTVLCALAFHDTFSAGASYYGVADAAALARDTHKFEARYLDTLIGPWPERADLYRARSPLHAADRISCPVIFFQGLDDAVVPPSQSEAMVAALRQAGIPAELHVFEGESHGFRRGDTIARCLEAELDFYRRVLGLS